MLIGKINKDEKMHEYLIKKQIKWKFNVGRAPSWDEQFERMVVLVKQFFLKATGRANLTKQELKEISMDIETALNNLSLIYIEDDLPMPDLTLTFLLYGQPKMISKERLNEDTSEMKRNQRYIKSTNIKRQNGKDGKNNISNLFEKSTRQCITERR